MTAIAASDEATTVGGSDKENDTLYNEQVVFRLEWSVLVNSVKTFAFQFREQVVASNVLSCKVEGAAQKLGALHTRKVMSRRTPR